MLVKTQRCSPRARIERWAGVRPPSSGAPSAPARRQAHKYRGGAVGCQRHQQRLPAESQPLKARPIDADDHR
eukprot:3956764-Prymnesium_polylepis.1